jgi:hypothetical protein
MTGKMAADEAETSVTPKDTALEFELKTLRAENEILKENERIKQHLVALLHEYPPKDYSGLLPEIKWVEEYLAALREANHERLVATTGSAHQHKDNQCAANMIEECREEYCDLQGRVDSGPSEFEPVIGTFAQLGVVSESYIEELLDYDADDEDMGGLSDSYFERGS